MGLRLNKIEKYLGLKTSGLFNSKKICNVQIDSRKILKGDIFIAIKGEKFDAHDFITEDIIEKSSMILADKCRKKDFQANNSKFLFVSDTVIAMLKISSALLKDLNVSVVGVTGTNGKTSTRAAIAVTLSSKYRIDQTIGNFNNRIGLPLSIFAMKDRTQKMVLEMGTNHFGEIRELTSYALPSVAVITNIGDGHLEFFKNRNGVLKAKQEIAEKMHRGTVVVVNGDDKLLADWRPPKGIRKVTYGCLDNNEYRLSNVRYSLSSTKFVFNSLECRIKIPGRAGLYAGGAAMAVASVLGCSLDRASESLQTVEAVGGRLKMIRDGGITLVNDTYNANPDSAKASAELLSLANIKGRAFLVLGEMGELGKKSASLHKKLGHYIASIENLNLYTLGIMAENVAKGASEKGMTSKNIHSFKTEQALIKKLSSEVEKKDVVLFKASRSVGMERLIQEFRKKIKEN